MRTKNTNLIDAAVKIITESGIMPMPGKKQNTMTALEAAEAIYMAADRKATDEMKAATEMKNKGIELYKKAYRDMMDAVTVYERLVYKESLKLKAAKNTD